MSVTGSGLGDFPPAEWFPAEGAEIEHGMQVLEVAGVPEGIADAGRVEAAITADEARLVWGFQATDPHQTDTDDAFEIEITVTRESTLNTEGEVSANVSDGGVGWDFNRAIWDWGLDFEADTTNGLAWSQQWTPRDVIVPVPFVWQEDETWYFTFFTNRSDDEFNAHEVRCYFTELEEAQVPRRRSVIDP